MHALLITCAVYLGLGAASDRVLDWATVARLAHAQSPAVQLAFARRAETLALQQHISVPSSGNPELALTAGPGFVNAGNTPALEFMVLLTWPFDVSQSAGARRHWARQRGIEADLELDDAARLAVGEALDVFARGCGAQARVQVAQARVQLDGELVRIAQVRRAAGDVGDGDVALARLMRAEGEAQLKLATGERDSLLLQLATRLGLAANEGAWTLQEGALPALPDFKEELAAARLRPDLRRAAAAEQTADLDHTVQKRLGWPVPRVTIGGGRGPEYQGELGLTVPLPVYQRNQASAAVAAARRGTASTEASLMRRAADNELHAAYAQYAATQAAYQLLQDAQPAIDDAEHLALRAFDLGQTPLAQTVVTRREVIGARIALQEAKLAMLRARVTLCVAAGNCYAEVQP